MKYISIILLSLLLFSCRTTRDVQVQKEDTDSTSFHTINKLQQKIKELKEYYEAKLKDSSAISIEFEPMPEPNPSDTSDADNFSFNSAELDKYKNQVKFKDGKIVEANGRIKSINITATQLREELGYTELRIDSVQKENEQLKVELSKKTVSREVHVKRSYAWWLWIVFFTLGWFVRGKWPVVKKLIHDKVIPLKIFK